MTKTEQPVFESHEKDSLNYAEFCQWFKDNDLEKYLDQASFEKQIETQEQYYRQRQFYGHDFKIDRNALFIEKERLERIKHGLEVKCINYALIITTPEELTDEEQQQTEAEYVYHKLLEPLKEQGLKIWMEKGAFVEGGEPRWKRHGLTLDEWLKRVLPVEPDNFDAIALEKDWENEFQRLINQSPKPAKQKSKKLEVIFIDNRQNVPRNQTVINQNNQEISIPDKQRSFLAMIKNKINILTPEQWIVRASQLYQKDKVDLAGGTWDWLGAIIDYQDQHCAPSVFAASTKFGIAFLGLDSKVPEISDAYSRWRLGL